MRKINFIILLLHMLGSGKRSGVVISTVSGVRFIGALKFYEPGYNFYAWYVCLHTWVCNCSFCLLFQVAADQCLEIE